MLAFASTLVREEYASGKGLLYAKIFHAWNSNLRRLKLSWDEMAPTEFQRWSRPTSWFNILALCPNFAVRSRRSKEAVKRVSPLHTLKTLGFIKYSQPSMFFSISPDLERVTELEFRQVKK